MRSCLDAGARRSEAICLAHHGFTLSLKAFEDAPISVTMWVSLD